VTQPQIGAPYDSGIERLVGLRRVPVKGFEKYLLFYTPRIGDIDVVRVLHAARDIQRIFESDES
jgi:toxin ParE1/3/4